MKIVTNYYKSVLVFLLVFLFLDSVAISQNWLNVSVKNYDSPAIKCTYLGDTLGIVKVSLHRTNMDGADFKIVSTPSNLRYYDDTIFIHSIDTTLSKKAVYKYYVQIHRSSGVEEKSPVVYGHNLGYIPSIQFYDITYISSKDSKEVNLHWQLTQDPTIKGIHLYRSRNRREGFQKIATLGLDQNTYTDMVERANEAYYYFFEAIDYFDKRHISNVFHAINNYAIIPLSPLNVKSIMTEDSVLIQWRRPTVDVIGYNIYRSTKNNSKPKLYKQILDTSNTVKFIDTALEAGRVAYIMKSVSDGYLESVGSEPLVYFRGNRLVPVAPSFGSAFLDSLNQINLFWESLAHHDDVFGYQVTKVQDGTIEEIATLDTDHNYFLDKNANPESSHKYEIFALNSRGGKSNIQLEIPYTPKVIKEDFDLPIVAQIMKASVAFQWSALPPQIKKVKIYKAIGQAKFTLLATLDNAAISYKDTNTTNSPRSYMFFGLDGDGKEIALSKGIHIQ